MKELVWQVSHLSASHPPENRNVVRNSKGNVTLPIPIALDDWVTISFLPGSRFHSFVSDYGLEVVVATPTAESAVHFVRAVEFVDDDLALIFAPESIIPRAHSHHQKLGQRNEHGAEITREREEVREAACARKLSMLDHNTPYCSVICPCSII